ncbi:uncharacterized protein LOC113302452 isoform X2 [Papaver somniferum]|uniref:uncharacterized protein LOC113302452 isoform X2 n=1 Tax=Papaver somniferum TaxID=3469 RepID=UPI000E702CCA|nr:uncharacterized protein LOC113302452 isoform X2 [Papaver somniferum]XP_026407143.1 uncharacterized protein LOC113302452 isoform X2 [Papaver somniferum]XP_026407144.1 uncharacterized protein LOC113302452 isoform X2 [Papaver somniferum]
MNREFRVYLTVVIIPRHHMEQHPISSPIRMVTFSWTVQDTQKDLHIRLRFSGEYAICFSPTEQALWCTFSWLLMRDVAKPRGEKMSNSIWRKFSFAPKQAKPSLKRDDVADHNKWSKRFGCDRVLHSQDIEDNTADVEIKLDGDGPWNLGNDFELFHTPGHTRGSVCLLYKPLKVLFAGDHISKDQSELSMGEQYNQQSVPLQLESVRKLLDFEFEWILPGHGRRVEFKDTQEKNKALKAFLVMKGQAQTQSV